MAQTKAVLQFRQDSTHFGAEAVFLLEIRGIGTHQIIGGKVNRIRIEDIGTFNLKARLENYESKWITICVEEGDVVDLIISPPSGKWNRAFSLLGSKSDYLQVIEISRRSV